MPMMLPAPHHHGQGRNEHLCSGPSGDLCENFLEMCTGEQNYPAREEEGCHFDSPVPYPFPECLHRSIPHLDPCGSSCNPTSCQWLTSCSCLICANPIDIIDTKEHLLIVLIGISLISNRSEHLYALIFWISSFVNYLFRIFLLFFWVVPFFYIC